MQHPDEGTIHSWLDGALSPEQAVEMESHIAACPSCAAAVAEARGFIAASSRILTALDHVPRGVIPAAPGGKRDLRVFWRAAAAMLVVAGGSLVVMREGGQDASVSSRTPATTTFTRPATTPPQTSEGAIDVTATNGAVERGADRATVGQAENRAASPPSATPEPQVGRGAVANERDLSLRAERRSRDAAEEAARSSIAADAIARPSTAPVMGATVSSPASEPVPLKVLKVERAIGSRRTTYEVAPSQTVVLTEQLSVQLEAVVVGGAGSAVQRQAPTSGARAVAPMRVEPTPATPPPPAAMRDSRSVADSTTTANQTAAVAKTAVGRVQSEAVLATAPNTISWKDSSTGNTLTLTGNMSIERLQEIRQRIERERAAAATKTP